MLHPKIQQMAHAIRFLSFDMIEKASSGHPGIASGMADVMAVLFAHFLKFCPKNPHWQERDRFVLSAGHGSAMLYALMHLLGYGITLDDLKQFRQYQSKTPGHPEYHLEHGIETTTGPLGQGLATAVGMTLARDRQKHTHAVVVLASDGDLMEGVCHEACSFVGAHQFKKFIILHDANNITIDGPLSLSCRDDQCTRFKAYGFNVLEMDGHDYDNIYQTFQKAFWEDTGPVFISCRTKIGFGTDKEGDASAHGSPLGKDSLLKAREKLEWPYPAFHIPQDILDAWKQCGNRSLALASPPPHLIKQPTEDCFACFQGAKEHLLQNKKDRATRESLGIVLSEIKPYFSELIGGSADLTPSNNTKVATDESYIHYGIREHAMGAIMNGISLYNEALIPYGGTFLVFSDYLKPSLRLSALMKRRVIYIFTHDSIGVGEDGPTHQPIEHLWALRAIPDLLVMRPCDDIEVAECLEIAMRTPNQPTALILSRQKLPQVRDAFHINESQKGGYLIHEESQSHLTILATGSEVHLALEVQKQLKEKGVIANVASLVCLSLFDAQPDAYKEHVLGKGFRVSLEMGASVGWYKYVSNNPKHGLVIGIDQFGMSAPLLGLVQHFGFTSQMITEKILKVFTI